MRVLLIFPPGTVFTPYPPLGLTYLAAFLQEQGHEVSIVDAAARRYRIEDIVTAAARFRPEVIGLSIYTAFVRSAYEASVALREHFPTALQVAGGPHVTVLADEVLAGFPVDVAVIGEGEVTLNELLSGKPWEEIPGISYRSGGRTARTPARPFIADLDSLPFPARNLLDIRSYHGDRLVRRMPYTTVLTSRGCPFNCSFCCNASLWGRKHRRRSATNILAELEILSDQGFREIYFPDDLFTANRKAVRDLCRGMIDSDLRLTWKCLSRVDTVDRELLQLMSRAGCHTVEFGVESGDPLIQRSISKRLNFDEVRKAFRDARAAGLETRAFFMIGNLGETGESVERTIRLACELNPDSVSFSAATPLPGTGLYREATAKGLITADDWSAFDYGGRPVMRTERLSVDEIERWQWEGYRRVYGSRRYLRENILKRLTRMRPGSFRDWLRLALKMARYLSARAGHPLTKVPALPRPSLFRRPPRAA